LEKEFTMPPKTDIAVQKFATGYNCAQSVLSSFSGALGLDENTASKIACGFGAGMGRKQEVCGAVTGGIMVIGLKYGNVSGDDRESKEKTYALTRELMNQFERKHGSCNCRKLLNGCDLSMETGQREFREKDLHNNICKECVRSAVEMVEEIL
jgi:C_GCAxxG_C_C family probable redox protein